MFVAIKKAVAGELPCEGYPIRAVVVPTRTPVPSGYDGVLSIEEYRSLKDSLEGSLRAYQQTTLGTDEQKMMVNERCLAELATTDHYQFNPVSTVTYEKKVAWNIYRQYIRDIYNQPASVPVLWPEKPSSSLLILTAKPILTPDNTESWSGLLWDCCEQYKYDKMNEDAIVGIGLKAALTGDAKAQAIQAWVVKLWFLMYTPRRDALLRGETVSFDYKTNNPVPYPVWGVLNA